MITIKAPHENILHSTYHARIDAMPQDEVKYKLTWIASDKILDKHSKIITTQASCWVFTQDKKVILVSKDKEKWTITAGHPESTDSDFKQTAIREVYEESGLDISAFKDQISMLGYYIVETLDKYTKKLIKKTIQIRFFIVINAHSFSLKLKPNERQDQTDKIKFVNAFTLSEAALKVKWLPTSKDFIKLKKILGLSID